MRLRSHSLAMPFAALLAAGAACASYAAYAADETAPVLDTPAQAYVRKLPAEKRPDPVQKVITVSPTDSVMAPKRRGTKVLADAPETTQRIEEIRVYSYRDPADYITPEKSPLLQMRDQLDRVRRPTPADRMHTILCVVGFCGGTPEEISAEDRKDIRMRRTTLELGLDQAGGGPLQ